MMFGAACVLAVVLVSNAPRKKRREPSQEPDPGQPGEDDPADPADPADPGHPGKKLPADCKITGDVFSAKKAMATGLRKTNVYATYHYYAPMYETSPLACAANFWKWGDGMSKRLMQYPWSAWCIGGSASWNPDKMCGRCFRIKNRATGASIIIRAVDSGGCSGGAKDGLDLDPCAFNAIDTDGKGKQAGNLMVDVEEVAC